jgi:DNA-binding PadR family transcriptional regulator
MPPRLVGLYALTCMERDGVVYGYSLASRIAERTSGAWRPGPGAIYPALQRLTDRGFARVRGAGRRREYRITPEGRRFLRKVRRARFGEGRAGPDLSLLWADIAGSPDDSTFFLQRLRRNLDSIEEHLSRVPTAQLGGRPLREHVIDELRAAEERLGGRPTAVGRTRPRRGVRR